MDGRHRFRGYTEAVNWNIIIDELCDVVVSLGHRMWVELLLVIVLGLLVHFVAYPFAMNRAQALAASNAAIIEAHKPPPPAPASPATVICVDWGHR